jgi:glycosyltransferase involved in cell wall biosynthesis
LERARRLGLDVQLYDLAPFKSKAKARVALASALLAARIRRLAPGLVHVHCPLVYGALRHAVRLSRLPSIVHVHIEPGGSLCWALKQPPTAVVTCAAFLREHVATSLNGHRYSTQVCVIPNSVDCKQFAPGDRHEAKQAVGAPANEPLLLMLANLAPHKGQLTALRAVAELAKRGIRIHCWIAGVDREPGQAFYRELLDAVTALGIGDRVKLLGFRSDTALLLQAADFFLLPSTHEGLPLSILEAQASKVPVLAAPTAGVPEVIQDGETGFLIAAADHCGYADRIATLLLDQELRQRVTQKAYERCLGEYTWERYMERLRSVYRNALSV